MNHKFKRYTIDVASGPRDDNADCSMYLLIDGIHVTYAYASMVAVSAISDACTIYDGDFYAGVFDGGTFDGGHYYGGHYYGGSFDGGQFYGGKFRAGRFCDGVYYDGEFNGEFSHHDYYGGVFTEGDHDYSRIIEFYSTTKNGTGAQWAV